MATAQPTILSAGAWHDISTTIMLSRLGSSLLIGWCAPQTDMTTPYVEYQHCLARDTLRVTSPGYITKSRNRCLRSRASDPVHSINLEKVLKPERSYGGLGARLHILKPDHQWQ
jgi:hypothetical protein